MSLSMHRIVAAWLLLCVAGFGVAQAAVDESDLLPVDQAFALTATAPTRDRIELHWKIADGYYLYRHRIAVDTAGPAAGSSTAFTKGKLEVPHGKKHHDEFFGEVETFRKQLVVVQSGAASPNAQQVTLQVKYQGCADLGVCYPPQKRTVTVQLPAVAVAGGKTGRGGLDALARSLGGSGGTNTPMLGTATDGTAQALPLPPEQAFGFEAIVGDGNTLLLRFTPAKGYYLYRDKTAFATAGAKGIAPGKARWPKGTQHRDEHFGDVVVYFDQVDVPLPLQRSQPDAADIRLTTTFQGCQTDGICYPPMTRTVALALPAGDVAVGTPVDASAGATSVATGDATEPGIATDVAPTTASSSPPSPNDGEELAAEAAPTTASSDVGDAGDETAQAEDSRLAALLAGNSRGWALLLFFAFGLGLAFTPCVLPMIPILSGLIVGQGTRLGTGRALVLSLVYVVASALVFTVAGIVAGLIGANLQVAFQNPWIIAAFAALFVVLALSSFGLYELQLPASLRSRLGEITDRQHGGSLWGVAAMGALSALIVGPCVAPPLAAAVLYIGQTHDPVFGGLALFLLAMGMGVPLLAFGVAAGRGLPRSGPWMTTVQRVFGFVFLALAVWMVSRILPSTATLALWGLLLLAAAAWAMTATPQSPRSRLSIRFIGLLLAVLGAAELFGALAGGSDPLQPLAGLSSSQSPASAAEQELAFRTIKSSADLDRELAAAQAVGKPVMFDFYADWCVSCKEMEKYTFTDPAVHASLARFVLLKADVTDNDATDKALMQRFGIIGPPATLFFTDSSEHRAMRLIGYEKAAPFVARVQRAGSAQ